MVADDTSASGSVSTVARIGDTVRRPAGPWTPTVHALLRHLEAVGFVGAPRAYGIDEHGREVLSWLPGEVATRPWPGVLLGDAGLRQIARWLRAYHDAVADFVPPPDAVWRDPRATWSSGSIVRHSDLGPWNSVWQGDLLAGFIDWDLAEPGQPMDDLCEIAWNLVPISASTPQSFGFENEPDRRHRLAVICRSYGADPGAVLAALPGFIAASIDRLVANGTSGAPPWSDFLARGDADAMQAAYDWLSDHAGTLA